MCYLLRACLFDQASLRELPALVLPGLVLVLVVLVLRPPPGVAADPGDAPLACAPCEAGVCPPVTGRWPLCMLLLPPAPLLLPCRSLAPPLIVAPLCEPDWLPPCALPPWLALCMLAPAVLLPFPRICWPCWPC